MSSTATSAKSLLGLEVLRVLCALSVLVWHYQHFYFIADTAVGYEASAQPLYAVFKPFYEAGWLGVQAFWCISGFIFFWKYAHPVAEGRIPAFRFAALRFSRLYPLHLLTLLGVAVLAAAYRSRAGVDYVYRHNDLEHFVANLFFASEWAKHDEWSFNGPIWSVSLEVPVYALFFVLCRIGCIRWWTLALLLAAVGASHVLRWIEHPLVLCIFYFYLGAITQLTHAWLQRGPRTLRRLGGCAMLLVLACGTLLLLRGRLTPRMYMVVLAPSAIMLALHAVQPRSARLASYIAVLGNTTYASYLIHFPLQLLVALLVGGRRQELPLHQPIWLFGFVTLSFGSAILIYRNIEMPAQTWLRRRLKVSALASEQK